MQLINDTSSDRQKLLRYFNGTAIVACFTIKDTIFAIFASELIASSSASSIVVPTIFVIHLVKSAPFSNATKIAWLCAAVMMLPLTRI